MTLPLTDTSMDLPLTDIEIFNGTLLAVALVVVLIMTFMWDWRKERVDMNDLGDVMMHFHTDPDYDDFSYVMRHGKRLPQKTFRCWLYGVSLSQPHYIEYYTELHGAVLTEQIKREVQRAIRRVQSAPTAELLDCMWAIYFGCGQSKFSDIVANVARGNITASPVVSAAASWSYKSIMGVRAE